jgi:hypothetical protein
MVPASITAFTVAAAVAISVAVLVATLVATLSIGVAMAVWLVGIVTVGSGCLGRGRVLHFYILFGSLLKERLHIV